MFDDEISREGLSFEESPRGEGEVDSNEGSASVYASVDMADGEEDGEIKREETTLLERSLVGAGVSRPLDVQSKWIFGFNNSCNYKVRRNICTNSICTICSFLFYCNLSFHDMLIHCYLK